VVFEVFGDGRRLAATPPLAFGDPARELAAEITGVRIVELVVRQRGGGQLPVSVTWGDARVLQ
jgi:alpha-galactosidase